jgi:hypothetical protein
MAEKSNSGKPRRNAFDAAVGRVLRGAQPRETCPDAELLAAYFERTLHPDESIHWEEHFSLCTRCQEQLAAMARSEPATEKPAVSWVLFPRLSLKWLVPAFAALGAVALWVAIRPAPEFEQARVPEAKLSAPAETSPTLAKPAVPESTATEAPKQLAAPTPAKRRPDVTSVPVAKQPLVDEIAKVEADAALRGDEAKEKAAVVAQAQEAKPAQLPPPATPAAAPAQAAGVAAAEQEAIKKQTAPEQLDRLRQQDAGRMLASRELQKQEANAEAKRDRSGAANFAMKAGVASPAATRLITTPGGAVRWAVGAAGRIFISRDAGQSWVAQESGVRVNLSAGHAPSDSVCWVVGQRGTILRTTDGHRWEKLAFPLELDLVKVEAADASHASVFSADGQVFVTEDGGKTWRKR